MLSSNGLTVTLNPPLQIHVIQFPIPNSQFPIPNSQFPIPNSQFPIPNSQFYSIAC
ncbi:MAG: hypothetical protein F6K41_15280 [Symploca sp. SIO3E6]|nr:hypothetical protein [Caldora sp. SIO3E6]